MVDIEKLRKITKEALRREDEERQRKFAEEQESFEKRLKSQEFKAELVISQISLRCKTEAVAGRNYAIVMSIRNHEDYQPPAGESWAKCEPTWLKGAGKIVYEYCEESRLKPTIEFWYAETGGDYGFNIVVHW